MYFICRDIADEESQAAESTMVGLIKDLGVSLLPDASPATKYDISVLMSYKNHYLNLYNRYFTFCFSLKLIKLYNMQSYDRSRICAL